MNRPEDNTIQLFDLNDASLVKSLPFESTTLCVFPRQQGAAVATDDGVIHYLDSSYEREVGTLTGYGQTDRRLVALFWGLWPRW